MKALSPVLLTKTPHALRSGEKRLISLILNWLPLVCYNKQIVFPIFLEVIENDRVLRSSLELRV